MVLKVGLESIAYEAEGRIIGYWLRGHEGERNIVLVKSNQLVKNIETKIL